MLYMALCFVSYAAGARHLPATLAPNPYRAPGAIRAQLLAVEAPTARALPRLNPLTWLPHALWEMSGDRRPGDASRLLTSTARVVASRDRDMPHGLGRHLVEITLAIRIGRNGRRTMPRTRGSRNPDSAGMSSVSNRRRDPCSAYRPPHSDRKKVWH